LSVALAFAIAALLPVHMCSWDAQTARMAAAIKTPAGAPTSPFAWLHCLRSAAHAVVLAPQQSGWHMRGRAPRWRRRWRRHRLRSRGTRSARRCIPAGMRFPRVQCSTFFILRGRQAGACETFARRTDGGVLLKCCGACMAASVCAPSPQAACGAHLTRTLCPLRQCFLHRRWQGANGAQLLSATAADPPTLTFDREEKAHP
jgi:hypothetical protein